MRRLIEIEKCEWCGDSSRRHPSFSLYVMLFGRWMFSLDVNVCLACNRYHIAPNGDIISE